MGSAESIRHRHTAWPSLPIPSMCGGDDLQDLCARVGRVLRRRDPHAIGGLVHERSTDPLSIRIRLLAGSTRRYHSAYGMRPLVSFPVVRSRMNAV
jgi:hypothetical protein